MQLGSLTKINGITDNCHIKYHVPTYVRVVRPAILTSRLDLALKTWVCYVLLHLDNNNVTTDEVFVSKAFFYCDTNHIKMLPKTTKNI